MREEVQITTNDPIAMTLAAMQVKDSSQNVSSAHFIIGLKALLFPTNDVYGSVFVVIWYPLEENPKPWVQEQCKNDMISVFVTPETV